MTSSAALAVALIAGPLAGVAHAEVYSIMADSPTSITYGDAAPPIGYTYWVASVQTTPGASIWSAEPVCDVVDSSPSGLRNGKYIPHTYQTGCVAGTLANPGDGTGGTDAILGYGTGTLTVNRAAAIVVTAKTASFTYGNTVPNLDPTISGFVNGDSFSSAGFTAPTCEVYSDAGLTTAVTPSSTMAPGVYFTHCYGAVVDTTLYSDTYWDDALHMVDGTLTVDYTTGPGTYSGAFVVPVGSKVNLASSWTLPASCPTSDKFEYQFSTDGTEGNIFYTTTAGSLAQQVYTNATGLDLVADNQYYVRGHYLGDEICSESTTDFAVLTVYALGDSAYGGGWYNYSAGGALSGRSNFGFAVSKKPGTTNTYRGQLVWTFKNTWRFKASLSNFGKQAGTPPKGTLAGTGTLYLWNSETAAWDVFATGVNVNVAIQATYTPLKKSDPTAYAGSFKISIGTVPTSPAPALPTMQTLSTLLKGGAIKIA